MSPLGMLFGMLGLTANPSSETRTDLIRKYGFAIPNAAALKFAASWGPIVEMGAGTGYWASLLRQMKVNVIAYDNFEGYRSDRYGFGKVWTPILKGTPATLAEHSNRTLLVCWPDYNRPFATNCLKHYKGKRLIYIGEGMGGCTANDQFHRALKKKWVLVKTIALPTWPGIHDNLYAYERR